MTNLFKNNSDSTSKKPSSEKSHTPLADDLRPQNLDAVLGQDGLVGKDGVLRKIIVAGGLPNIILWGDAGCGKTTIARLLAKQMGVKFHTLSAVFSGVADLRKVFQTATTDFTLGQRTVLFVDEIHRFNKAQQDSFLPYMEDGTIILIGATTQNPSFELNKALLSRSQVYTLNKLTPSHMNILLERAQSLREKKVPLNTEAKEVFLTLGGGDGRYFLNMVEILLSIHVDDLMTTDQMLTVVQRRMPLYDKGGDNHYNLLSAFHKSIRGSDVQSALYWMGRMLKGGEDGAVIARRMLVISYEDVGLADIKATEQVMLAWDSFIRLGSPEGVLPLVQACIYLATAPKSNTVYKASTEMFKVAEKFNSHMPPKSILNSPTKMMKQMGYGAGYKYDHDFENSFSGQDFHPQSMQRPRIYSPNEKGFERDIKKRFDYYENLRKKLQQKN